MTAADIHTRLLTLGKKLQQAEDKMKLQPLTSAGHALTNSQLRERYSVLLEQVNRDVNTSEAHGHHVSDLERSVMLWYEGLDNGSI